MEGMPAFVTTSILKRLQSGVVPFISDPFIARCLITRGTVCRDEPIKVAIGMCDIESDKDKDPVTQHLLLLATFA